MTPNNDCQNFLCVQNDFFCGILTEDPDGYHFKYDEQYMAMPNAKALSPTMPLQIEEYEKVCKIFCRRIDGCGRIGVCIVR